MRRFTIFRRSFLGAVVCLLLSVAAVILTSCGFPISNDALDSVPSSAAEAVSDQRLMIVATIDYDAEMFDLPSSDKNGIHIRNLANAEIVLSGEHVSLKEAIATNMVTMEEMVAWAKLDSSKGFCKEIFQSQNGLAHYVYRYAQIELSVYDDVYETPDGQRYRIKNLTIRDGGGKDDPLMMRYLGEDGFPYPIDREDWGLTWEMEWSQEQGLVLRCTQEGGQQIGQLVVYGYIVASETYGTVANSHSEFLHSITANGKTEIPITLDNDTQVLSGGDYGVRIAVKDVYDESKVHPLMRNYYDAQTYYITFSVP